MVKLFPNEEANYLFVANKDDIDYKISNFQNSNLKWNDFMIKFRYSVKFILSYFFFNV